MIAIPQETPEGARRVRVILQLDSDDLRPLAVIVECWRHTQSGRGRRAMRARFDPQQLARIAEILPRLQRYFLERGGGMELEPRDFALLRHAADAIAKI